MQHACSCIMRLDARCAQGTYWRCDCLQADILNKFRKETLRQPSMWRYKHYHRPLVRNSASLQAPGPALRRCFTISSTHKQLTARAPRREAVHYKSNIEGVFPDRKSERGFCGAAHSITTGCQCRTAGAPRCCHSQWIGQPMQRWWASASWRPQSACTTSHPRTCSASWSRGRPRCT
jgi:hypothetical protein